MTTFEEFCQKETNEEQDENYGLENELAKEYLYNDRDSLISLTVQLIHERNINFFKLINSMDSEKISVYEAPANDCKMILLNIIITYLDYYLNFDNDKVIEISKNIIDVYNSTNIIYLEKYRYTLSNLVDEEKTKDDKYFKDIKNLLFIDNELINKSKNKETLTETEKDLFKIQVFTFASVFIDFDSLLDLIIDFVN